MHTCRYPVLHLHHSFPIIFEQHDSQKSLLCASYIFVCSYQTYLACLLIRFVNMKASRGSFHIPLCFPANTLQMRLKTASTTAQRNATALLRALVGLSMAWDYATRDASFR